MFPPGWTTQKRTISRTISLSRLSGCKRSQQRKLSGCPSHLTKMADPHHTSVTSHISQGNTYLCIRRLESPVGVEHPWIGLHVPKNNVVSNVFPSLQLRKPIQLRKVTFRGIWNLIVLHLGKHHTFYYTWLVISWWYSWVVFVTVVTWLHDVFDSECSGGETTTSINLPFLSL